MTARPAAKTKTSVSRPKKAVVPGVKKTQKLAAVRAQRPTIVTPPPRRQPTVDESAALMAFERAHKEFTHGRFGEARNQFRALLDKYSQVSEVAARATNIPGDRRSASSYRKHAAHAMLTLFMTAELSNSIAANT